MRFARSSPPPTVGRFDPELRVIEYIATRIGESERGPRIWMHPADARLRLVVDGELVWVHFSRGQQVAQLVVDPTIPEHGCVIRDIGGVDLAEAVRVTKPNLDTPEPQSPHGGTVA
jgi:anaerobic selenocysteine-containing dehydrogenase